MANREREMKRDERDRFRKAMSKARSGGRDGGQRKLGRESARCCWREQQRDGERVTTLFKWIDCNSNESLDSLLSLLKCGGVVTEV